MLRKIFKLLILYLSCLFPRSSDIYVFGAWFGNKFLDNTKYLYLYFEKKVPGKIIWITKNKKILIEMKKDGHNVFMHNSIGGIWYQLRAKYFFICSGYQDVSEELTGNAITINLWHGIPLKKIMYDDSITYQLNTTCNLLKQSLRRFPKRKNYIISTSPVYNKIFQSAFRKDSNHIVEIGYPRNDILLSESIGELKEKYMDKTLIVYMPTHRKEGKQKIDCSLIFDLNRLDQFCEKNNSVFIIKKHYYHENEPKVKGYKNIVDITNLNIDPQQLLLSTDILISDYSGSYIDYLLLNRPILFYNFDFDDYKATDRDMYFDYQDVTPGKKIQSYTQLEESLFFLLQGNDEWLEERKRVTNIFFGRLAQSQVCPTIYEMIKIGRFI